MLKRLEDASCSRDWKTPRAQATGGRLVLRRLEDASCSRDWRTPRAQEAGGRLVLKRLEDASCSGDWRKPQGAGGSGFETSIMRPSKWFHKKNNLPSCLASVIWVSS